jgi:hypothetical protein
MGEPTSFISAIVGKSPTRIENKVESEAWEQEFLKPVGPAVEE